MSLNLVLSYESSALAAPQSFRDAMQAAANMIAAVIQNNITVTIQVGYGDWYNGQDTGITTGAEGGDLNGVYESYASIRAALASHETSAVDQTFVNSLPNTSSVNGVSSLWVPSAVAKALGFMAPNGTAVDGAVGMGTQIPNSLLVGVALHELGHAMGREPWGATFDLLRYTSPGVHLFSTASTAPAAYFSIDGGNTKLADFGQNSDPSDFLNSGVQGANDPYNEYYSYGTQQSLTGVDIKLMDVLGFSTTPLTQSIALGATTPLAIQGGAPVALLSGALTITDSASTTLTHATIKVGTSGGSVFPGDELYLNNLQSGTVDGGLITVSWDDSTKVLTLTGTASLATYQSLLGLLAYSFAGTDYSTGSHPEHTVTWTVNDGATDISATSQIGIERPPTVAVANLALTTGYVSVAASSLFTASDPDADPIAVYAFKNTGNGHFYLNGVPQATNQEIDVTAAQLSHLVYNNALGTDTVQVRVNDGTLWSSWGSFTVTGPTATVVQVDGTTSLTEVGTQFWVYDSHGIGHWLNNGIAGFVAGAYGDWSPIGAVQTATGYYVAWKGASENLYSVWTTDSNATMLSSLNSVSGSDGRLQAYESIFHQDLNGDGHIGLVGTVIQTNGSTSLTEVGTQFYVSGSDGVGHWLNNAGVGFVAGAYGDWSPIGAVQTATGFDVAWKGASENLYSVWTTDSNASMLSSLNSVSGSDYRLESFENVFQQDLNGDGHIGLVVTTIGVSVSTRLTEVGTRYFLYDSAGTGPTLKSAGGDYLAGAYGAWSPIGSVKTATGYFVAWKEAGADLYSVWSTDSNGNMLSSLNSVSGSDYRLESYENIFQQDLNGDAQIGLVATTIGTSATTRLTEVANRYFLYDSAGTGPTLKSAGGDYLAGAYGAWSPIGALKTATGYYVAWKEAGADLYSVWSTDSNGNMLSSLNSVSGSDYRLETYENIFHQDLNGDGQVGLVATTIGTSATTRLTEVANRYFLYDSAGTGPSLKSAGGDYLAGAYGDWSPIGAVKTATGYDVAWKEAGVDLYSVWTADSNASMLSSLNSVSGSDYRLQTFENIFHQDLNGDGHIGFTVAAGGTLEVPGAESGTVTFLSSTGTLKLDAASTFTGQIVGFTGDGTLAGSDHIDLVNMAYNSSIQSGSTYNSSTGILDVSNGTTVDLLHFVGSYSLANFKFASDGHGGTIVYDPPTTGQSAPASATDATIHVTGNATMSGSSGLSGGQVVVDAGATLTLDHVVTPAGTMTNNGTVSITNNSAVNILAGTGQDTFVFAPNFGQATIAHFAPETDVMQIDHRVFANLDALFAATHDDAHGNAVITDAAHDTITVLNVTAAQLHAHQGGFHLV